MDLWLIKICTKKEARYRPLFWRALNKNSSNTNCVVICPPAIYLNNFKDNTNHFYLGAQDISKFEKGAFTGEISAKSLTDFGVNFCMHAQKII